MVQSVVPRTIPLATVGLQVIQDVQALVAVLTMVYSGVTVHQAGEYVKVGTLIVVVTRLFGLSV